MICQRCGTCCLTMMVIVPVKEDGQWMARMKPGDKRCPHLSFDGSQASCAIHDDPIYTDSPCWRYGNSEVDSDFWNKRGQPCPVGQTIQEAGGAPYREEFSTAKIDQMDHCGPWPLVPGDIDVEEGAAE